MTKTIFAGTALAALAASAAFAAPPAAAPAPAAPPAAAAPRGPMGGDEGPVTRAQMQQTIAGQFAEMDTNKDGSITAAEMGERAGMIQRLDSNGDGKLTVDEVSKRMLGMFDMVDANHDGIVTPEERSAFRDAMRARQGGGGEQPR